MHTIWCQAVNLTTTVVRLDTEKLFAVSETLSTLVDQRSPVNQDTRSEKIGEIWSLSSEFLDRKGSKDKNIATPPALIGWSHVWVCGNSACSDLLVVPQASTAPTHYSYPASLWRQGRRERADFTMDNNYRLRKRSLCYPWFYQSTLKTVPRPTKREKGSC